MKVIKQSVYEIQYGINNSDYTILVEADSIIEAIDVAKTYFNLKDLDIRGVHTYRPIIKKLTKTVTVEL